MNNNLNRNNSLNGNNNIHVKKQTVKERIWNGVINATEFLLDVIKAAIIVGGVLASALADIIFGSISASILFGGNIQLLLTTPSFLIGFLISLATSAIQIIMWQTLQKRNIGFKQLFHWSKLPMDIKGFLGGAILIWLLDDFMDIAPVFLLIRNSQYQTIPLLYNVMVVSVLILVFIICSFSELLTSNLRAMLEIKEVVPRELQKPVQNFNRQQYNNQVNIKNKEKNFPHNFNKNIPVPLSIPRIEKHQMTVDDLGEDFIRFQSPLGKKDLTRK